MTNLRLVTVSADFRASRQVGSQGRIASPDSPDCSLPGTLLIFYRAESKGKQLASRISIKLVMTDPQLCLPQECSAQEKHDAHSKPTQENSL
jgi:hypothetical protein